MERHTRSRFVAEGACGEVFLCRDTQSNSIIAVKWIPFDYSIEGYNAVLREVVVLKELNHENVVRLLDVVEQERGINLVFEYMELDLARFIYDPSEKSQADLSHEIKKVIHRNLKPRNLLLDSGRRTVKLADFGFARPTDVPLLHYSTDKMMCIYPDKRITAYDALKHPYLSGARTVGMEQIERTVSTK